MEQFLNLPRCVQNEVNDRVEHDNETKISAAKIRHGRSVIKLRRKYRFATNRLGLN